ncbi:hypothetical protein [Rhizobium sp. WYCCWR10014]|uniref:hypothetical protein n=1 Tax=Rhizobium sp. WYCCWR10014 TaxID=1825933 RepID=UPI0007E3B6D7|nr:hypothetical protein [Rhizobium sp. WYCCWR10014]OAV48598.1 hypothetical protein A6U98_16635 [Rhizobium sp. WYCCWR10014]
MIGSERVDVGRLIGDRSISDVDAAISLYDLMEDGMGVLLAASPEGSVPELVAGTTARGWSLRNAPHRAPSALPVPW